MDDPIQAIATIHPIINSAAKKIFWSGDVKLNQKGKMQPRYCILSNTGFYLFRKKQFPAGLQISKYAKLNKLRGIRVNATSIHIKISKKAIAFSHEKIVEIAAIIGAVLHKLFGKSHVTVDPSVKDIYNSIQPKIGIKSALADRFVSYAADVVKAQFVDLAQDLYLKLEKSPTSLTVTPEIATSVFMDVLTDSVAHDTEVTHLKLRKLTMGSFCHFLSRIFKQSHSINQLSLIDFSFAGYSNDSEILFSDECVMPLKTLRFIRSELNRPEFTLFVSEFTTYKGDITSLHIDSCLFDEQTIDNLFVSFFDADCFRNLEHFSLVGGHMPQRVETLYVQLLGSNWIEKHQTLKTISAMNTEINSDFILPVLTMLKNNIESVNFSGCKFMSPIQFNPPPFSTLKEIDFSRNSFTQDSLLSFFKGLAADQNRQPNVIILDAINVDKGIGQVISKLSDIILTCLTSFSFSDNLLNENEVDGFCNFLKKQKNINTIYLSNTLPARSKKSLSLISDISEKLPLQKIVLKSKNNIATKFDTSFSKALKAILGLKSLTYLDITGQEIGDKGIEMLKKYVEKGSGIKELIFDETKFDNCGQYIGLLNSIMNSSIEFSILPEKDVASLVEKGQDKEAVQQIRNKFAMKYGGIFEEVSGQIESGDNNISLMRNVSELLDNNGEIAPQKLVLEIPKESFDALAVKENGVEDFLRECFGEVGQPEDDILVKSLREIVAKTSINRILQ
ncbi:hypothetical protein GPJ56_002983 [Histomonas meleagridis]|uniref:uncharacterized protein n=1 Tax=Histomonas meleagridis TaxID=135588 RepID=UPI003559ED94|nr:hypothetical protein GPJ56_002983 [Histomonas meleagridis]KAH0796640.1 hypothetical protein GO595_010533 [Histomonas meleagridis]